jgi:hypothetical protein
VIQALSKTWVLGVVIALCAGGPLGSGCGGDDDGGDGGAVAERCPQAGGLDDGCICTSDRPAGIRYCQDDLLWSVCECGPPFEEDCQEGDPVECTCPGESEPRTTVCLAEGTYDCDCD